MSASALRSTFSNNLVKTFSLNTADPCDFLTEEPSNSISPLHFDLEKPISPSKAESSVPVIAYYKKNL